MKQKTDEASRVMLCRRTRICPLLLTCWVPEPSCRDPQKCEAKPRGKASGCFLTLLYTSILKKLKMYTDGRQEKPIWLVRGSVQSLPSQLTFLMQDKWTGRTLNMSDLPSIHFLNVASRRDIHLCYGVGYKEYTQFKPRPNSLVEFSSFPVSHPFLYIWGTVAPLIYLAKTLHSWCKIEILSVTCTMHNGACYHRHTVIPRWCWASCTDVFHSPYSTLYHGRQWGGAAVQISLQIPRAILRPVHNRRQDGRLSMVWNHRRLRQR